MSNFLNNTKDLQTILTTLTECQNGAVSKTLSLGETFIIPKGYHPGTGKVTSPYIKLQTFYTGSSEPSADLGVVGDLYFMTSAQSGGSEGSTSPTLISFDIYGVHGMFNTTYQAEEGMTWIEWCSSSYNPSSEWVAKSNVVEYAPEGYVICDIDSGEFISPSEVIISGGSYSTT